MPVEPAAVTHSEEPAGGHTGTLFGRAVSVERVPAGDVPADYPADVDGTEALAVGVSFDETDEPGATVYFEWPPTDEGPLERLLALRDVWHDRVEDLRGERVPVEPADGHYLPVAPDEAPYGSPLGYYALVAGLGLDVALFAGLLGGLLPPGPTVATTLLLVNFVLFPAATYLDGWYLRTHTDWEGNPLRWAALSGFVGINVFSVGAYLWQRRLLERY